MTMQPRAIIGDIHGSAQRLSRALECPDLTERELIFVGDYVNKGPASRDTIDILIELKGRNPRNTFLRGNHDDVLLRWLAGGDIGTFVQHGGLTTIASYVPDPGPGVFEDFRSSYPSAHRTFLELTVPFYEMPALFVSHAGYHPGQPESRDADVMIYGRHPTLFRSPQKRPQDLVVFGHYVQRNGHPFNQDGIVCLDTGCGTLEEGKLTALLLPERVFLRF